MDGYKVWLVNEKDLQETRVMMSVAWSTEQAFARFLITLQLLELTVYYYVL